MNVAHAHERHADDVGAYLLGALDATEERAFEDHLDACPVCQEEVERLSLAVDALPASVDQYAPPPELKKTLMAAVRADAAPAQAPTTRRGWREWFAIRPAFAAGLAAAFLAVGIAVGLLAGGGDDTTTRVASVDANRLSGTAKVSLVEPADAGKNGGALIKVTGMPQAEGDRVYEVWAKRGDKISPVSLFEVASDGSGSAAIPDKLDGVDAIYVTREPHGGSDVPSEMPVVSIDL
jgi:anti-sigma-K factor RskA